MKKKGSRPVKCQKRMRFTGPTIHEGEKNWVSVKETSQIELQRKGAGSCATLANAMMKWHLAHGCINFEARSMAEPRQFTDHDPRASSAACFFANKIPGAQNQVFPLF